jgi:ABC-2 type transport system ATP-binding protein
VSTAPDAIRAESLVKRYHKRKGQPVRALDGFSLHIPSGAWVALLGPNGSGKSTFLKLVTRSMTSDEGQLEVLGVPRGHGASSVRGRLGVVFQSPGLDKLLTVRENLLTQGALFGMDRAASRERAESCARAAGIESRLDDRVGTLSGGLARRTDLARALLSEPELLLLDEPTTGLDPEARASFLDLIERTRRERPSMTIVMSTHLMDEADRCDSVALVSNGRVVAHESPGALRAGLGDLALHAAPEQADALRELGLEVRTGDDRAVGAGDIGALAHAAGTLASRGVAFALEPPTLEDVYLAHTNADGGPP